MCSVEEIVQCYTYDDFFQHAPHLIYVMNYYLHLYVLYLQFVNYKFKNDNINLKPSTKKTQRLNLQNNSMCINTFNKRRRCHSSRKFDTYISYQRTSCMRHNIIFDYVWPGFSKTSEDVIVKIYRGLYLAVVRWNYVRMKNDNRMQYYLG